MYLEPLSKCSRPLNKPESLSSFQLRKHIFHSFLHVFWHVLVFKNHVQVLLLHRQPTGADLVEPFDVFVTDDFDGLAAPFHATMQKFFGKADVTVRASADQFSNP